MPIRQGGISAASLMNHEVASVTFDPFDSFIPRVAPGGIWTDDPFSRSVVTPWDPQA